MESGWPSSGLLRANTRRRKRSAGRCWAIATIRIFVRPLSYWPVCRSRAISIERSGPKFLSKVEEVRKLLSDAEGYYNSGRYDLAFKKYEQVLNLDPYNVAARRGEEKINLTKTHYGEEAYNETRSRQLWQVQKGWEQPVRPYGQTVGATTDAFAKDATGTARITQKLNTHHHSADRVS